MYILHYFSYNINMKKYLKNNIIIVCATFLIPGIISFLMRDSFSIYKELILPKYAPPSYLFPVAWNVIYILNAISAIFVKENDKCLVIYYIQIILNALWSPIFFLLNNYLLALIELAILLVTVIYMSYSFYKERKFTIYLLIPYIIWLLFAFYLNYFVYIYN